jgi:flavin reductase (DIM6/NTAB) family NADH-FMN oxidoreductase RutF
MGEDSGSIVDLNKEVMNRMAAGVAVMTLVDSDGVHRGMTISSLTPVSADPPSVLMCIGERASSRPALVEGQTFCANILASDQVDHSMGFAWGDDDPFEAFEWSAADDGTPILSDTCAHLLCEVERVIEHHGTAVVLAKPIGGGVHKDDALVYWMQKYFGEVIPVDSGATGVW